MAKIAKVDYDKNNDSLFIYSDKKVHDSLEIGNYLVDFDSEDKIAGVEIFEASRMLGLSNINQNDLSNIVSASINVSQGRNSIYLKLVLKIEKKNIVEEKEVLLSVPRVVEGSIKAS